VLVAAIDDNVVGFATPRLNSPEEGEGVLFAVAPEAQGSGIYRSFVVSGMHWCKEQGVRRMVVSTRLQMWRCRKYGAVLVSNRRTRTIRSTSGLAEEERMDPVPAPRSSFKVGDEATISRTFTQDDVEAFSRLSGDNNPVHLDEEYAKQTRFGGRIIHGMLVSSLISCALATVLPGPGSIYLSQQLSFRAPAKVGERLTARVRVNEWDAVKGRIILGTEVVNDDGVQLIVGEAKLVLASFLK